MKLSQLVIRPLSAPACVFISLLLEILKKIQNQGMRNQETNERKFLHLLVKNYPKGSHTTANFYLGTVLETRVYKDNPAFFQVSKIFYLSNLTAVF